MAAPSSTVSSSPRFPRKRRTRGHVIADLSANHVERFFLQKGHSVELFRRDYGLDLLVFFYDSRGMILDGQISIQLKATDQARYVDAGRAVSVEIDERDLRAWANRLEPVILVLFDANLNRAYWLYVQASDQCIAASIPGIGLRTRTIRLPTRQRVNLRSIDTFLRYNAQIVGQVRWIIRHENAKNEIR